MTAEVRCVDCIKEGVKTARPTPHGGPRSARCTTHHRGWLKRNKDLAHGRRLVSGFGITSRQYWELYKAQGGRCFICQRATGASKRLAVEHEHGLCDDHPPEQGCPRCIRCLACGRCNRLIAFLKVDALRRAIEILTDPPARKILNSITSNVKGMKNV